MKEIYYISGAVSSDPDYKVKFEMAERILKAKGFKVINPVKRAKAGKPWEYYMRRDLKLLLKCTGIILLDDWCMSKGASLECMVAEDLKYKIYKLDSKTLMLVDTEGGVIV